MQSASKQWSFGLKSFTRFLRRMMPSDAERIVKAFSSVQTEGMGIITDPIENDPQYAELMKEIEGRLEPEFSELRIGICHTIWRRKKQL